MEKLRLADLASEYLINSSRVDKSHARDNSPSQLALVLYQPSLYKELREKYNEEIEKSSIKVDMEVEV